MIKVCEYCHTEFDAKNVKKKFCSKQCHNNSMGGGIDVPCCICGKNVHRKTSAYNKIAMKDKITCSLACSVEVKKSIFLGKGNPNSRHNIPLDYFNNIDSEEKAWVLGWIAGDGHVSIQYNTFSISIVDLDIVEIFRDIFKVPISKKKPVEGRQHQYTVCVNSKEMAIKIRDILKLPKDTNQKERFVSIPNIGSHLIIHFIRGFFEAEGSIRLTKKRIPTASISSSSSIILNQINDYFKGVGTAYFRDNIGSLEFSGVNCLDFLGKMYNNETMYKLKRKYDKYLDIITYQPCIHTGWVNVEGIRFNRTREDAVAVTKAHMSDSGFDLTILEKVNTVGNVDLYDTGIKVSPPYGYYFDLVPRSSIIKTGYILANSVGIIDQSYLGSIKVPLIKINVDMPELPLPSKIVQLILRPFINFTVKEVDSLEDTERGGLGFGSSDMIKVYNDNKELMESLAKQESKEVE